MWHKKIIIEFLDFTNILYGFLFLIHNLLLFAYYLVVYLVIFIKEHHFSVNLAMLIEYIFTLDISWKVENPKI